MPTGCNYTPNSLKVKHGLLVSGGTGNRNEDAVCLMKLKFSVVSSNRFWFWFFYFTSPESINKLQRSVLVMNPMDSSKSARNHEIHLGLHIRHKSSV